MQVEAVAPLYGREPEVRRIGELLDGPGGALVLSGPAGIGKTALLDAAAAAAGRTVLACRGAAVERHLPFAALHQLLSPVLELADVLPAVQVRALRGALGLEPVERADPFLVGLATLSLLAEAGPVLCLIDDAHWLDGASADALFFAARRLQGEPVAIIAAVRDGADRPEARLTRPDGRFGFGVPELRLSGLDPDAARALLSDDLAPAVADRLVDSTGGNPLALLELSAGLTGDQRAGTAPVLGPLPASAEVERQFLAGVRRLPDATQRLLLVAAADDGGDLVTVLEAAGQLGVPAAALDAAETAGLVRVRDRRLELRHPLVRSAIYHGAPLSQRREAHGALASVLTDARADRRAWHRAAASVDPDPEVVDELASTARRAQQLGAYDAASHAFERAAALSPSDDERARLLTAAAETAWLPGKASRARELLRQARAHAELTADRADADRVAGLIELTSGVPVEAAQHLLRAARQVATADAERALALLSLASWAAVLARDSEALVAIADSADLLVVEDTAVNRFLRMRMSGLRAHFVGAYDAAAPQLQATLELVDELTGDVSELLDLAGPAGLFLCDDRPTLALHRRLAQRARDDGALTLYAQTLPWVILGDVWAGRWPAAAARLEDGLALTADTGQAQIHAHLVAISAHLDALRGNEDACRRQAAEAIEAARTHSLVHVMVCATWGLMVLDLGLGAPEAALASVRALPPVAGVDWDALERIEAAYRAGEPETARAWLDRFEPWAQSSAAPWGRAVALHGRALLAEDTDESVALFEAALTEHDAAERPFERARTELAFGERLRRARRRTEARVHLRAALDCFETLGAAGWAERARVELRASGERSRRRDPSTLDDLTAQERQIARLVAEGGTNREIAGQLFLSPRTIDFHLRNVFRKLGITSRTALARLDLEEDPGEIAGASAPMDP